jgi:long-subunit fatty acid transport protein
LVLFVAVWGGFSLPSAQAQFADLAAEFAGAGARPLSMGGAFLALADDSTAAEFNPAGIRILRRPELAWQVTHTFDKHEEYLPLSDLFPGQPSRGVDRNEWSTPSFISYVKPGQDWTVALSQLTTIDFHYVYTDSPSHLTDLVFQSETEVTNNAYGITFATDLQPRLHLGVTLRMNRFDFEYHQRGLFFDGGTIQFSDWSPSVNVGLLWRKSKNWSFGAVFKSPQWIKARDGDFEVDTRLPYTAGVGVAYHPNDRLRLLADVDYIDWSAFDNLPEDQFVRNDVVRYHVGGEYLFCLEDERAWFLRAGAMHENSNAIYYKGSTNTLLREGYPEQDDLNHLSIGLGVATEKYQIDLALDQVLDGRTTLILSMIHYF